MRIWSSERRVKRKPKPIAEDTANWHFGSNALILGLGVVVLLVVLAFLSIV